MNLLLINLIAICVVFLLAIISSVTSFVFRDKQASSSTWWLGLVNDLRGELWGAVLTSVIFTFIVTTAEQVQERQNRIDDLARAVRSSVNMEAIRAIEELRALDLLAGDDGILKNAILDQSNLQGVNLQGANLTGVSFFLADLRGADLRDANLEGANFAGANLDAVNFAGANLRNALIQTDATKSNFYWMSSVQANTPQLPPTVFSYETILPNAFNAVGHPQNPVYNFRWTDETDMSRYTNPEHPDFWQPQWVVDGYSSHAAWLAVQPE